MKIIRKEVLTHLGIKAGDRLQLDLLPGGRAEQPVGPLSNVFGFLKNRTNGRLLTIDEIQETIADAGAAAGSGVGE